MIEYKLKGFGNDPKMRTSFGFFSTFIGLSSLNDGKFQEHLGTFRIFPLRGKFAEIPLFFPFDFGFMN